MSRGARAFFADPRVARAKELLREALVAHQAAVAGVSPADPALTGELAALLARFGEIRGNPLHYPLLGSGFGRGARVELADGSIKLDMATGIGVHVLGHSDPDLLAASVDAALRDVVMQGNLHQNVESAALAERLVAIARESGARLAHAFLATSGAIAVENALKIAFQNRHPADRLLAFDGCFHGRTLALAQATDVPAFREGLPRTVAVDYVPFFDPRSPVESRRNAVTALERHLRRHPGRYAAMCFELVQGEGGVNVGDRDFFLALFEVCRRDGVLVLADEIQTFGRTTRWFAFQHFRLDEWIDLVTVGKLTQACGTLFTPDVRPRPGLLSQTFTAPTAALFAAQAILDRLSAGGAFGREGRNARLHERFAHGLERLARERPGTIAVEPAGFGLGGMIAFRVFDGSAERTKRFLQDLFDRGVIAYSAGTDPVRVRFLPPLGATTDEDVDEVCHIVGESLAAPRSS